MRYFQQINLLCSLLALVLILFMSSFSAPVTAAEKFEVLPEGHDAYHSNYNGHSSAHKSKQHPLTERQKKEYKLSENKLKTHQTHVNSEARGSLSKLRYELKPATKRPSEKIRKSENMQRALSAAKRERSAERTGRVRKRETKPEKHLRHFR